MNFLNEDQHDWFTSNAYKLIDLQPLDMYNMSYFRFQSEPFLLHHVYILLYKMYFQY